MCRDVADACRGFYVGDWQNTNRSLDCVTVRCVRSTFQACAAGTTVSCPGKTFQAVLELARRDALFPKDDELA